MIINDPEHGIGVVVWFDESSVRDHFEISDLDGLSDLDVIQLGRDAADAMEQHDGLWAIFDEVLTGELENIREIEEAGNVPHCATCRCAQPVCDWCDKPVVIDAACGDWKHRSGYYRCSKEPWNLTAQVNGSDRPRPPATKPPGE